ncbi:MAG: hypothetical protein J1F60_02040 [Oscillospiraceae bacterium]|nr:hypothetical protein [Oscillospiraceae bacterium]
MANYEVIKIGSTPNILKVFKSFAKDIVIKQTDLKNALSEYSEKVKGHTSGHNISIDTLNSISEEMRNPIMVLQGSKSNPNSVVLLTNLKDTKNDYILLTVSMNRQNGKVNNLTSIYGKKNLSNFLTVNQSRILAVNTEKAEQLYRDIGIQYSKLNTVICYDNSITYSLASVKYPDEKKLEGAEKEMTEKENYCLFTVEIYGEIMNYRDNTTSDINTLMNRYVECESYLPSFTENCIRISEVEFADLEQHEKPMFCAEINVDKNALTVWDNEKIANETLENAINSIKESGTIELSYEDFANKKFVEEMQQADEWADKAITTAGDRQAERENDTIR